MVGSLHRRYLFLFAVYVFLSVVGAVYDYHDPAQSATCPICFMRGSLSSAVGQSNFVPQTDGETPCLALVETKEPFWNAVSFSGLYYRGPPLGGTFSLKARLTPLG